MDNKKVKAIISLIWLIFLVLLWIMYPFLADISSGDLFIWMWAAIIWSVIGGVIGIIIFMPDSQKKEMVIGTIWATILVLLWVIYPIFPGNILTWQWTAIIWSILGGIAVIILFFIKRSFK